MLTDSIKSNGKEIILVGTAHVSHESVELVKKTIQEQMPDVVAVELDYSRFKQLKSGKKWRETDILQIVSEGKTYLFLVNLLLSSIQRQIGEKLGIKPGEEMLQAINAAKEQKIPIALVDRDVTITLKRAMERLSLIEKAKLFISFIEGFFSKKEEITQEKINELKNTDAMNKLMQELAENFPSIKEVLVDERDLFIANKILSVPGKKIVAVLGAGHLQGVKKYLDKKRPVSHLNKLPEKKKSIISVLKWIIPITIIALFAYTFFAKGFQQTIDVLILWFLINGFFSALGVLIARGHPLSIITAFLVAPITSLQPFLAAGWFAGMVEAKINSPKVKDFEDLNQLNSFKDFQKNQFTKVLLVVALANVGSTIGTFIAFPWILATVV
ncbi:MAG: TraB/GumN family protein [Candidatus Diapherotrites archaeon]